MAALNLGFEDNHIAFHGIDSSVGLEGSIVVPKGVNCDFSTINEPIRETFLRDAKAVGKKVKHVLFPCHGDLWGPFTIFVILALILQLSNSQTKDAGVPEFAQVFTIFWLGALSVSINSKLLGGTLSFFQVVCILGYCILPLVVTLSLNCAIKLFVKTSTWLLAVRLLIVLGGLAHSIFASVTFIRPSHSKHRVALAVYPLCLFYFFIGWLIFVNTGPASV
ncbi:Yip1 member 6 [Sparganum proliferum]